jgi:hypothetical protein
MAIHALPLKEFRRYFGPIEDGNADSLLQPDPVPLKVAASGDEASAMLFPADRTGSHKKADIAPARGRGIAISLICQCGPGYFGQNTRCPETTFALPGEWETVTRLQLNRY